MKKYVLDTHLYIRAIRSEDAAAELTAFYSRFVPATYMSSVVLHELLVGARTPARAAEIMEAVAGPFKRTRRLITPSASAWEEAALGLAAIAKRDRRELRTIPKSLVNDVLLAASCREAGATLITANAADFHQISRFIKVQFVEPWPR